VVHLAVIVLAVRASGLTATPTPRRLDDTILIFEDPPKPVQNDTPRPATANRDPASSSTTSVPVVPDVQVSIPTDIPNSLPDLDAMQPILDHAFNPTRVAASGPPGGQPNGSDGSPLYTENIVEKAVVAIPGTATPRYPSMLQSAGVEGNVRAQFVVDTLGRVEQGSFRALGSTHDLFTTAVRDALSRARFKPAEVGGRRVRQLVEQSFSFSITR
jgi:protein TonB